MDTQIFLERVKSAFDSSLPGIEAHKLVTPGKRPLTRNMVEDISSYRESAVAVVCYPYKNQTYSLLIQRPQYEGTHGGQISFPGGKIEPSDSDLEFTARRETQEEIGWKLLDHHYVGKMTELFIPVSRFSVQPYLYLCDKEQSFLPDPREVFKIISFPIEELNKPSVLKTTDIRYSDGVRLKDVPYFDIHGKIVWGATAIILSELREMIR